MIPDLIETTPIVGGVGSEAHILSACVNSILTSHTFASHL